MNKDRIKAGVISLVLGVILYSVFVFWLNFHISQIGV